MLAADQLNRKLFVLSLAYLNDWSWGLHGVLSTPPTRLRLLIEMVCSQIYMLIIHGFTVVVRRQASGRLLLKLVVSVNNIASWKQSSQLPTQHD